jgi:hypothetical protein
LIKQWGYEDYSSDSSRDTNFFIPYTSVDSYTVGTSLSNKNASATTTWAYPPSVISRTNQKFRITSKSNLADGRLYYEIIGY